MKYEVNERNKELACQEQWQTYIVSVQHVIHANDGILNNIPMAPVRLVASIRRS
jgi:hypothetical protein